MFHFLPDFRTRNRRRLASVFTYRPPQSSISGNTPTDLPLYPPTCPRDQKRHVTPIPSWWNNVLSAIKFPLQSCILSRSIMGNGQCPNSTYPTGTMCSLSCFTDNNESLQGHNPSVRWPFPRMNTNVSFSHSISELSCLFCPNITKLELQIMFSVPLNFSLTPSTTKLLCKSEYN